jgi:hypothetical protein
MSWVEDCGRYINESDTPHWRHAGKPAARMVTAYSRPAAHRASARPYTGLGMWWGAAMVKLSSRGTMH